MKNKIFLSLAAAVLISACGLAVKSVDSKDIGLRKASLENENVELLDVKYSQAMAGESVLIERSFENAPPLIPHTLEDMLPIVKDNNICLSCHDKAIAKDVGAIPLPSSHYFDFRTNKSTKDVVSEARFNCTQCHVPQSDAKPLVGNSFEAKFKNEDLKKKSNLLDVLNEGVK
ncbi:periplasmic nitrate reductase, small subunit, cytochrome c550 protein [Campylobacter peloridis]|uniref:Periplasmic nitrate reductase, electron transfer subunit n=1 Tax=Campylobacter peloridis TaxID=488546 RepID=A0A5C7DSI7_9BACT|nr:periplasmic nitrate reductase, small subunit, cytochrome c550 protein [Campylobacter peloridis]AJC84935.1 periplasmic nitrate reductase NapAB, small subunit, periplasmic diheme cytochrome c550 protein [Campylobacter peloridis LMG 23910]MBX1886428.1 periplasmic nitrate reductase, small subunit, cytochrome c550 protein [Campylobacter peloridis]QOQ88970.1 periplasmic nitrate reductase, small subunit, cytochrome c550 protein [Campylobacter peloridis]TXE83521.1 periplasmic nitrate reductase, smal